MRFEQRVKFPCGYECSTIISFNMFGTGNVIEYEIQPLCPIHGKDCHGDK